MLPEISFALALGAGLLSLLSPCVLALVPAYVTYLSGSSASNATGPDTRRQMIFSALLFIFGFSAVFVAFGASASALGQLLLTHQVWIQRVAGVLVILFGLHVMGVFSIGILDRDVRFRPQAKGGRPLHSAFIGAAFAAGWAPCVGPILGGILMLAAMTDTVWQGVTLLAFYSLGMGIPFLLIATFLGQSRRVIQSLQRHQRVISLISGALLIGIGVMLFTNLFVRLAQFGDYYLRVYERLNLM